MAITKRQEKGSPITWQEYDETVSEFEFLTDLNSVKFDFKTSLQESADVSISPDNMNYETGDGSTPIYDSVKAPNLLVGINSHSNLWLNKNPTLVLERYKAKRKEIVSGEWQQKQAGFLEQKENTLVPTGRVITFNNVEEHNSLNLRGQNYLACKVFGTDKDGYDYYFRFMGVKQSKFTILRFRMEVTFNGKVYTIYSQPFKMYYVFHFSDEYVQVLYKNM